MKNNINIAKKCKYQKHSFHIVRPSPWPFLTAVSLFNLAVYLVLIFHDFKTSTMYLLISLGYFFYIIGMWFRDVIIESHQGMHTLKVQRNFRYGFVVFLVSEAMFFFGFFWCYFYMSLSPSIWIGCVWPPLGIVPINPSHLPLFNTILLISSGVNAVFCHKCIMNRNGRQDVTYGLIYTICLGIAFTACQVYEYSVAEFSINDGIFGSIFYVSTGFHGLHVNYRYRCFNCLFNTSFTISFFSWSSYRFRTNILILTFCWYYIWILLYACMYIGSWPFGYSSN